MKMRNLVLLIILLFLIVILGSCVIINQAGNTENGQSESTSQSQDQEEASQAEDIDDTDTEPADEDSQTSANDLSDLIIVDTPQPDQIITSPLVIEGQARGTWFFEASFPVRLLDAEGNIIVEYYAQTEEEWMTEEFISFSSRLEFDVPATDTGILILIKDNPSDIAEFDAQLDIPILFR